MTEKVDAIVIGGGFYGCVIALFLAQHFRKVTIIEQKSDLLLRASYVNQARVHTGYHYPRSLQTAASSAQNLIQFREFYDDCIDSSFTCLYAIAANGSKVTSNYFERFCRQIDLPIKAPAKELKRLFSPRTISAVYECEEFAFDADALRNTLRRKIDAAGLDLRFNTRVDRIEKTGETEITAQLTEDDDSLDSKRAQSGKSLSAPWVFNTTYANLNQFSGPNEKQRVSLRHQVTEICLIRVPDLLENVGVTVMDGPFFSAMPFPARKTHSLSHVRYTPHLTWHEDDSPELRPDIVLAEHAKSSKFEWMLRDSVRYLPLLAEAEYEDSLFEIKSTLVGTQIDDARPIAFHRDPEMERFISILGGKIDNIFDVLRVISGTLDLDDR